jgi:hypothetical protein
LLRSCLSTEIQPRLTGLPLERFFSSPRRGGTRLAAGVEGYVRSDHPSTNGFALTGTNPSMRRKHAATTGGLIWRNQQIRSRPGSSLWLLAPPLDTDPAIDPQLPVESSPMTKGATCNRGRVDGDVEFKGRMVAPVRGQFASRSDANTRRH